MVRQRDPSLLKSPPLRPSHAPGAELCCCTGLPALPLAPLSPALHPLPPGRPLTCTEEHAPSCGAHCCAALPLPCCGAALAARPSENWGGSYLLLAPSHELSAHTHEAQASPGIRVNANAAWTCWGSNENLCPDCPVRPQQHTDALPSSNPALSGVCSYSFKVCGSLYICLLGSLWHPQPQHHFAPPALSLAVSYRATAAHEQSILTVLRNP